MKSPIKFLLLIFLIYVFVFSPTLIYAQTPPGGNFKTNDPGSEPDLEGGKKTGESTLYSDCVERKQTIWDKINLFHGIKCWVLKKLHAIIEAIPEAIMNFIMSVSETIMKKFFSMVRDMLVGFDPTVLDTFNPIHEPIFKLIIPFFILQILYAAFLFLFSSISPAQRAQAKDNLWKAIVSMVLVSVSPALFKLMMQWNQEFTTDIFAIGGSAVDATLVLSTVAVAAITAIIAFVAGNGLVLLILGPLGVIAGLVMSTAVGLTITVIVLGMIGAVLIILLVRYSLIVVFYCLFPLTIFLLFFPITRRLGGRILGQTIIWIVITPVMALIVLSTVAALGSILEIDTTPGSPSISGFNEATTSVNEGCPGAWIIGGAMKAIIAFLVAPLIICSGLALLVIVPLMMTSTMQWAGAPIAAAGMMGLAHAKTKTATARSFSTLALGQVMMGRKAGSLSAAASSAAYVASDQAPLTLGGLKQAFTGGSPQEKAYRASDPKGYWGARARESRNIWTGDQGLLTNPRDAASKRVWANENERLQSQYAGGGAGPTTPVSGGGGGSAASGGAQVGKTGSGALFVNESVTGESGVPPSSGSGRLVGQSAYGDGNATIEMSSERELKHRDGVSGSYFIVPPLFIGRRVTDTVKAIGHFAKGFGRGKPMGERMEHANAGAACVARAASLNIFFPIQLMGMVIHNAAPMAPPVLQGAMYSGGRAMAGLNIGQMRNRAGYRSKISRCKGDYYKSKNEYETAVLEEPNGAKSEKAKKAKQKMDASAEKLTKNLDDLGFYGTSITGTTDKDFFNRQLAALEKNNPSLYREYHKRKSTRLRAKDLDGKNILEEHQKSREELANLRQNTPDLATGKKVENYEKSKVGVDLMIDTMERSSDGNPPRLSSSEAQGLRDDVKKANELFDKGRYEESEKIYGKVSSRLTEVVGEYEEKDKRKFIEDMAVTQGLKTLGLKKVSEQEAFLKDHREYSAKYVGLSHSLTKGPDGKAVYGQLDYGDYVSLNENIVLTDKEMKFAKQNQWLVSDEVRHHLMGERAMGKDISEAESKMLYQENIHLIETADGKGMLDSQDYKYIKGLMKTEPGYAEDSLSKKHALSNPEIYGGKGQKVQHWEYQRSSTPAYSDGTGKVELVKREFTSSGAVFIPLREGEDGGNVYWKGQRVEILGDPNDVLTTATDGMTRPTANIIYNESGDRGVMADLVSTGHKLNPNTGKMEETFRVVHCGNMMEIDENGKIGRGEFHTSEDRVNLDNIKKSIIGTEVETGGTKKKIVRMETETGEEIIASGKQTGTDAKDRRYKTETGWKTQTQTGDIILHYEDGKSETRSAEDIDKMYNDLHEGEITSVMNNPKERKIQEYMLDGQTREEAEKRLESRFDRISENFPISGPNLDSFHKQLRNGEKSQEEIESANEFINDAAERMAILKEKGVPIDDIKEIRPVYDPSRLTPTTVEPGTNGWVMTINYAYYEKAVKDNMRSPDVPDHETWVKAKNKQLSYFENDHVIHEGLHPLAHDNRGKLIGAIREDSELKDIHDRMLKQNLNFAADDGLQEIFVIQKSMDALPEDKKTVAVEAKQEFYDKLGEVLVDKDNNLNRDVSFTPGLMSSWAVQAVDEMKTNGQTMDQYFAPSKKETPAGVDPSKEEMAKADNLGKKALLYLDGVGKEQFMEFVTLYNGAWEKFQKGDVI